MSCKTCKDKNPELAEMYDNVSSTDNFFLGLIITVGYGFIYGMVSMFSDAINYIF